MFVISRHEVLKWHRFLDVVSRVVTHLSCKVNVKCYRISRCVLRVMLVNKVVLLEGPMFSLLKCVNTLCSRVTNVLETLWVKILVSAEFLGIVLLVLRIRSV